MHKSLKYAAAAAALFAAAGAYAASDDGTSDTARLDKDAATLHMEPQVVVEAPSVSLADPAPAASGDTSGVFTEPGVVTQYDSATYYAMPSTPSASMTLDGNGQMDSFTP